MKNVILKTVTLTAITALSVTLLAGCGVQMSDNDTTPLGTPTTITGSEDILDSTETMIAKTYTEFMLALNQLDVDALNEWATENASKAYDPNLTEKEKKALLRSVKALFNETVTNSVYDTNLTLDEQLDFWLNLSKVSGSIVLYNPIASINVDENEIVIKDNIATIEPANIHIQVIAIDPDTEQQIAEHYPTESDVQLIKIKEKWYYNAAYTLQSPVTEDNNDGVSEITEQPK